jgi:hypothetical protein
METLMNRIAEEIKKADGRVSAYVDGGTIKGTFRGKKSEDYCYMVTKREFVWNNEGPNVRKAVEAAIAKVYEK